MKTRPLCSCDPSVRARPLCSCDPSVRGSVVAFGCYMLLIGRIGAEYAAYVTLLMPVIALLLSTLFEDFQWTAHAAVGVAIVLVGNLFILTPAATIIRACRRFKS